MLFVTQYKNDNIAFHRTSAVSGSLALEFNGTALLTAKNMLITSLA